jgi:hypothetical protein
MRRTTSSGSEGDGTLRPSSVGITMQSRTGLGGGGPLRLIIALNHPASSAKTTCSPTEEKKSLDLMERLLEVSIDSQNMLREHLDRGAGDNRGWAEDPSRETDQVRRGRRLPCRA